MLAGQNHAAGGANGSIMVGMYVSVCFASQKPSEQEFFVPAGMDLDVKLLTALPYLGLGGNKKLLLHGIPTVGIVRKVPSTPTQLSHKHHHHERIHKKNDSVYDYVNTCTTRDIESQPKKTQVQKKNRK
jgi:hypothetical protein